MRYNNFWYTKNGHHRTNIATGSIPRYLKKNNPAKQDTENRKKVVEEIENLVSTGVSLDEACDMLSKNEDIRNNFKYLPQDSLKNIFANWYNGMIKRKTEIEKGR